MAGIVSGSFAPLHLGHLRLAAALARRVAGRVAFEISVHNVDKADLTLSAIQLRVSQFDGLFPVVVTRAATFLEKAEQFPGAAFAVGMDTATRIIDDRYYANPIAARARMCQLGAHFLVAGRVDAQGLFRAKLEFPAASPWSQLFTMIPEEEIRADVSSTQLRAARREG